MDGITTASVTALIGAMIWYMKCQTKQQCIREEKHDKIQAEDRKFSRDLIMGTLKDIHETGLENARLNRDAIDLQNDYQRESVATLKVIADRLNGGTEGMRAIKLLKKIDERKKKIKVEVERRA